MKESKVKYYLLLLLYFPSVAMAEVQVREPSFFVQLFIAAFPIIVVVCVMWWHAKYMHRLNKPYQDEVSESLKSISQSLEEISQSLKNK